jgi:hypothetical protein
LRAVLIVDFAASRLRFKFWPSAGWSEFPACDVRLSFLFGPSGEEMQVGFEISEVDIPPIFEIVNIPADILHSVHPVVSLMN